MREQAYDKDKVQSKDDKEEEKKTPPVQKRDLRSQRLQALEMSGQMQASPIDPNNPHPGDAAIAQAYELSGTPVVGAAQMLQFLQLWLLMLL